MASAHAVHWFTLGTFAANSNSPNIFWFVIPVPRCFSGVSFLKPAAGSRECQVLVLAKLAGRGPSPPCLLLPGCRVPAQAPGAWRGCRALWSSADSWAWAAAPSSHQPGLSRPLVTTTPGFIQVSSLKSWSALGWERRNGKVKPRFQVGQSPEGYGKHLRGLTLSEGVRHKPSPMDSSAPPSSVCRP